MFYIFFLLILLIRGDSIKNYIKIGSIIFCSLLLIVLSVFFVNKDNNKTSELVGVVVKNDGKLLSVKDNNNVIYTFKANEKLDIGDNVLVTYTGLLNSKVDTQKVRVVECVAIPVSYDYRDFGLNKNKDIFGKYYDLAEKYISKMDIDEKIGQLLLVRYSDDYQSAIKNYHVGGFVFYENDFKDKTKVDVQKMISDVQSISYTPLLTGVDEEGGSVVRISSNSELRSSRFKSPSELYNEGGFDLIKNDTKEKSKLLSSLGINVNLAPVVDVASEDSYIFDRTLKEDTTLTGDYALSVISASKDGDVSYVLKHFPGYGDNQDTHSGESVDRRSLDEIKERDLPPFEVGINALVEAILVSHNTVNSIDSDNPASLSGNVHELLRGDLDFSGVVITDDLSMGATSSIPNRYAKALLAGNDILMVTDYDDAYNDIKDYYDEGKISDDAINIPLTRVIAWKFYKGLMFDTK